MDNMPELEVEGSGSQDQTQQEPVNEQSESVGQLEGRLRYLEKSEGPGCFQQCINGVYVDVPVVKEEVETHQEA